MRYFLRAICVCMGLFGLSGCAVDTPALAFSDSHTQVVKIGGNTFRVFTEIYGDGIEVHRTNFVFPPPSRSLIAQQAMRAMVQASGCDVKRGSLVGDQALIKAALTCSPF